MLKRVVEVVLAAFGLAICSPLLVATAVAIKLDSPGPVLFRQTRVGWKGKPFTLFKFRTMRVQDRQQPAAPLRVADFHTFVFSPPGRDPRVTRVGRLLRTTSFDELPQLYNVLRGDMSLVGPRPELPEIVEQYPPEYHRRHDVRPGITGLAQVSGRSDLTYHQIMLYDLGYVQRQSFWRDIVILLQTIIVVLTGKGAR